MTDERIPDDRKATELPPTVAAHGAASEERRGRFTMQSMLACMTLADGLGDAGLRGVPRRAAAPVRLAPNAGYRRTTVTSGGAVFVHDFEEYATGLVFSPAVYFDPAGQVYLAENPGVVEFHGTNPSIRTSRTPASASFTQWSKAGD